MKRALPLLLLALSCLDFERRVSNCFDGGVCSLRSESDAGTDAGSNVGPDAGADASVAFLALDAGFFCSDEWCWESPFPHGLKLNTVFAAEDDLIVAGDFNMVAERRGGTWRSFQDLSARPVEWRNLWGTSIDDVWLAGDSVAWHRTDAGWNTVGAGLGHDSHGVIGFDGGVFISAGPELFRFNGTGWVSQPTLQGFDVLDLAVAYGALHGSIRRIDDRESGAVKNFSTNATWAFDGGGIFTLFTSPAALFATGARTVRLNASTQADLELSETISAAVTSNGQLYGATSNQVGRVDDLGMMASESSVVGVRAMAVGRSIVAVGDQGLVFERRTDGGWFDPTPTASRSNIIAVVEFKGALAAVTADCELLERGAAGWTRRALGYTNCVDAVSDGSSLAVLTPSEVVTLDRNLGVVGQDSLSPGLEVRRLWRSDAGALVVTTATDVFVRLPGENFEVMPGVGGGAWGVSGRGSVARVCGLAQGAVADLDLSRSPPVSTPVPGLSAEGCRAVLPLSGGRWALASHVQSFPHLLVVATDGTTRDVTVNLNSAVIEALLETPTGVAVAAGRYAFVSFDGGTRAVVEPRGRFDGVTELGLWKGRLFVGGAGGSILQAPAP